MDDVLRPLGRDEIDALWVAAGTRRLRAAIESAVSGQCLRAGNLPRAILERIAGALHEADLPETEVYFVDGVAGPEPWRAAVHKVVERRNASEGVLLALFPPDLQLAAGDSVDISTFRVIPTATLADDIAAELDRGLSEPRRKAIDHLFRYIEECTGNAPSDPQRLAFLATVAAQPGHDDAVVGGALYALGLIPDFGLFEVPDELRHRLGQLNMATVDVLQDESATLLERVLRLRLTDEGFRARLIALLKRLPPRDVRTWGEAVATDPEWRDLSLDRWPLVGAKPIVEDFQIHVQPLRMARRPEDGMLAMQADQKVIIAWTTDPAAINVPGLTHFRVEVLNSEHVVVWESALIKVTRTQRRSKTVGELSILETGVYFFRVAGLSEAGDPIGRPRLRDEKAGDGGKRVNATEDFLLLEAEDSEIEEFQAVTNRMVSGFAEADFQAQLTLPASKRGGEIAAPKAMEWTTAPEVRTEVATATIRFDLQRQYAVRLGQRLRNLERVILEDPDAGGRLHVALGPQQAASEWLPIALPPAFAQARREVFAAVESVPMENGGRPVIAMVDLVRFAPLIDAYAAAYLQWLESDDPNALHLDVVRAEIPEHGSAALVAPTHPLRMLWLLQEQQLGRSWLVAARERGDAAGDLLATWRDALAAQGIPVLLVLSPTEAFMDAGPLRGGWGAYLPPRLRDSRAVLALLRSRLGSGAAHESEADIAPGVLAERLGRFLRQHAYVQALTVNVINPGDAALIVEALVALEKGRRDSRLPDVRYDVHLISESSHHSTIGEAFRALLDPERAISQAADSLVSPGRSFLFPKLTWSCNSLELFLEKSEAFQAHVTIILDAFPISVRVARIDLLGRSSFVHGLVQEAPRRLDARGGYAWLRQPAPFPSAELAAAPGRAAVMAAMLAAMGNLGAVVLAPNANTTATTAVTALDLDSRGQSLLYCAHRVSTWVLTLDPHLGLDYFDEPRRGDRPGYLLDFTPEFLASGGRQLLLTTRIDDEINQLMEPAAEQLGLDASGSGGAMLLETLRSLSGRLALKLLSSPQQVQGALGMALTRLYLEAYDMLSTAMIIPLDAHPELSSAKRDPGSPNLRGDLLVVSADPVERRLDFLLVEAKCRKGHGIDSALRAEIVQQLAGSESALRAEFDPAAQEPDRIDRAIQSWRLASVLTFYAERAHRYGLIDQASFDTMRQFFNGLDSDRGYELTMRKIGLVFRLDANESFVDTESDVPIHVVGHDLIQTIVEHALRVYSATELAAPSSSTAEAEPPAPAMVGSDTWHDVRRAFGGPSTDRSRWAEREAAEDVTHTPVLPPQVTTGAGLTLDGAPVQDAAGDAPRAEAGPELTATEHTEGQPTNERSHGGEAPEEQPAAVTGTAVAGTEVADVTATDASVEGVESTGVTDIPEYDVLLGDTGTSPQYGLIGQVAAETWRRVALDLNGCNTLSVFGVQGSGKSYTLGTIIEMATRPLPRLNVLPQPLATVLFHYHQTQDYPPEFVTMDQPNDDASQVAALASAWGAEPAALEDVVVLTTADTVAQRQREFPRAHVAPIAFSSAELTVSDWRFLMGATGSDALYLKLVNEIMRKARADLTLEAIHAGLADAPLSDNQRALAETRLDFASRFIDDDRDLRDLVRPGRLIVVDLRDEFIEQDQALGLFITMLNVFAGAGMGDERFNKLIVFDEAHKYMGGPLIGHVVGVIREMRHKGVSVVIASQDPVNVPQTVIELSSAVILHRFNAPNWLRHIQKSLVSLAELTPPMMAALQPGEALVWANRASDPVFTRRAVKVRLRPRVTKHGGGTRTAVG